MRTLSVSAFCMRRSYCFGSWFALQLPSAGDIKLGSSEIVWAGARFRFWCSYAMMLEISEWFCMGSCGGWKNFISRGRAPFHWTALDNLHAALRVTELV